MMMTTLVHKYDRLNDFLLFSIYSIFFLLPWYSNYSGNMQPVDILVLIATCLFFLKRESYRFITLSQSIPYLLLLILLSLIILRYLWEYCFILNNQALHDLLATIYYMILTVLFINIIYYLYQEKTEEEFYTTLLTCLLLNILLPLFTLIVFGADYGQSILPENDANLGRATLTFNNANQLGFFALINLSIFFYLTLFARASYIKPKKLISLLLININLIFITLSASRAAAPGVILYVVCYTLIFDFFKSWIKRYRLVFFGLLLILSGVAFTLIIKLLFYIASVRVYSTSDSVPFLYDIYIRMIEGIEHNFGNWAIFFFGYGSVMNPWRETKLEFHNNFLSIFNQIGFLGLSLYSYLIWIILIDLIKKGMLYALPFFCYLLYSDVHYAFRTRMNWLFFAMLIFLLSYRKSKIKL